MPQKPKLVIYPLKPSQILNIGGFDRAHSLDASAFRLAWWVLRERYRSNQLSDICQGYEMISVSLPERSSMHNFSNSIPCHVSSITQYIISSSL
jgi:hypothetical protein